MPKVINRAIHLRMFAGFRFNNISAPPQILVASTVFCPIPETHENVMVIISLVLLPVCFEQ